MLGVIFSSFLHLENMAFTSQRYNSAKEFIVIFHDDCPAKSSKQKPTAFNLSKAFLISLKRLVRSKTNHNDRGVYLSMLCSATHAYNANRILI